MNKEEKEVLKTLKSGVGLTSAEQEILVNYIDKLKKENKKYIDVFNATEKIMNRQERTKDKLLKENVELQKELDNSISKDKVREVLKDIYFYYGQNNDTFLVDKIRKELLGE